MCIRDSKGGGTHEWSEDRNRQIFRTIQRGGGVASSRSDSKRHKKARGASRGLFQYMNQRGSGRAQNTGGNSPSRSGRQTTSDIARRPLRGLCCGTSSGRAKKRPRKESTVFYNGEVSLPPPAFRTERGGYSACCCSVCPAEGISACGIVAAASDSMTRS